MTIPASHIRETIRYSQSYMLRADWNQQAITGADSGARLHCRLGRFAKGYLVFLPWSDNYVFLEAQGYW
jgi:hypothetical protein